MLNAIWAGMILLAVLYGAATGRMGDVTNAALDSAGEAVSLCLTMAGVVALWMGLMEIAQRAGLINKLTKGIAPFLRFLFPRIPPGHPAGEYIAANIIANVLGLGWACTPAGLKAMEELAKLEAQRGNPEYLETAYGAGDAGGAGDIRGERDVHRERDIRERMYAQTAGRGLRGSGGREVRGNIGTEDRGRGRNYEFGQNGNIRQGTAGRGRQASNEMCIFLILNISSLQLIPVNMIAYRSQYGSADPTAIIAPAIAATLVSTLVAIIYCKIKDHSARTGMGGSSRGSAADVGGMGRGGSGRRADLTAAEMGRASGSSAGFGRAEIAGMSSKNGKTWGGKVV